MMTHPRCGHICALYSVIVLDTEGCVLPKDHQGPHEFINHRGSDRYLWEYDVEACQDVYWEKPMREITTHKVNGLNEALTITVMDEPGQGNACHEYNIAGPNPLAPVNEPDVDIDFQNGPIKEAGVNGVSNEALLAIVRDRLECFQTGPYACDTNASALLYVIAAMNALHSRTQERADRGVEGTHQI